MSIEKLSTNASLKDVMDKFEELSFQDFSNIDVIVVDKLPSVVKNEQLCILKSDFAGRVYIAVEVDNNMQSGDIFVKMNSELASSKEFIISNSKANINLFIKNVRVIENGKLKYAPAYIGKNDSWELIEEESCVIFKDGVFDVDVEGMEYKLISAGVSSSTKYSIENTITLQQCGKDYNHGANKLTTKNAIDLSEFEYLYIDLEAITSSGAVSTFSDLDCRIDILNSNGNIVATYDPAYTIVPGSSYEYEISRHVYKLNIKNISGLCYISIMGTINSTTTSSRTNTITVYSLILGGEVVD